MPEPCDSAAASVRDRSRAAAIAAVESLPLGMERGSPATRSARRPKCPEPEASRRRQNRSESAAGARNRQSGAADYRGGGLAMNKVSMVCVCQCS
jgi:hypothetical protein